MKELYLEPELFTDLVHATSDALGIPVQLIEKDYYISAVLRLLSKSAYAPQIVFKGGTSLSKAYQLINRFSEDVDFAVISEQMSGNQVKTLLSHLIKEVTAGLVEDKEFPDISKGSKYRKQAFLYDTKIELDANTNPIPARIIVEISAFANPFPNEKRIIRKTKRYISAKRNVQIRKTKRISKRYFISTKAYSVMMSESIYKARGFISSPQYLNLISIVDKIEIGGK